MKKLLALFVSAALICPMWAGAQTTTTPSVLPVMTWTGSLELTNSPIFVNGTSLILGSPYSLGSSNSITSINITLTLPNNNSTVMPVNGWWFNGDYISFAGTAFALNSDLQPAQAGQTIAKYQLSVNAHPEQGSLYCGVFPPSMNMTCNFYLQQFNYLLQGKGNFTLVTQ